MPTHRRFVSSALALLLGAAPVSARQAGPAGAQEMRRLAPLVGEWEGTGWVDAGPNGRQSFSVHESARWAAGGSVLVLEGLGTQKLDDGTERAVHQALGVVSWDAGAAAFSMHAYRAGGGEVSDAPTVRDGGLVWGFEDPRAGRIRFTLDIDEHEWHEVGARSVDGATWEPFLEMRLERVGGTSPGS